MSAQSVPAPAFEGSEKRLELDFASNSPGRSGNLRSLSRRQLVAVLDKTGCSIVSSRSNAFFDAHVLSESSLFMFPHKVVLKTCGTTRLLAGVPLLMELAAGLDLSCCRCKYSRASFLLPYNQPEPYSDFNAEVALLKAELGQFGKHGAAYVLGDGLAGLQWHVFVADRAPTGATPPPTNSLEICMTDLCPQKAAPFHRSPDCLTAAAVTSHSGIRALLPGADIDDFVFEPCGYSMNALLEGTLATVHVTPEHEHSYASFELSGPPGEGPHASEIVSKVAEVFNPGHMTVTLSANSSHSPAPWDLLWAPAPPGFAGRGSALQRFAQGGHTAFYSCWRDPVSPSLRSAASCELNMGVAPLEDLASFSSDDTAYDQSSQRRAASAEDLDQDMDATAPPKYAGGDMCGKAGDDEMRAPLEVGEQCSRSPSPAHVSSVLSPCPLLRGQSTSAIAQVLAAHGAVPIPKCNQAVIDAHIRRLVDAQGLEDPLYVLDLGCVMRLYNAWQLAMPRVHPFYAVKCNTDPAMIALLAALGAGFDCASEAEVRAVMQAGVAPDRVVYANACKRPKDVRAAAALGVNLTTFDTVSELRKLAELHPATAVLLRIRADDPAARCQLGNKYGAEMERVPGLLEEAQRLSLDVAGVSFHVGSGATNPAAFSEAIALSRIVFDQGLALGFRMRILDIGGGFCGGTISPDGSVALAGVPAAVNTALEMHFPEGGGIRVIAEPGRYFAEASASLACMVIGVRDTNTPNGSPARDYWVTDGLYGSMNCVLYDHATLTAHPLPPQGSQLAVGTDHHDKECLQSSTGHRGGVELPSTVFGPTCDGLDVNVRNVPLPLLENGDWLVFPNMGAYTLVGASNFNGIDVANTSVFYVCSAGEGG